MTMGKTKHRSILDQNLILLPDRALFWEEEKMLIVADPHFGKAQTFREMGIPVPGGTTANDLKRLSNLMDWLHPEKLLFLGDLCHGRMNRTQAFDRRIDHWRRRYKDVKLLLVTGNHDRRAGEPSPHFRFDRIAAALVRGPFVFTHHPKSDAPRYGIAGHLHPAVTVKGKGRQKDTLPCFCFGARVALLPAFGSFTGNQVIHPAPKDRVYVIAGDEVLEMPEGGSR